MGYRPPYARRRLFQSIPIAGSFYSGRYEPKPHKFRQRTRAVTLEAPTAEARWTMTAAFGVSSGVPRQRWSCVVELAKLSDLRQWLFYFVAWPLILGRSLGSPPV